MADAGAITPTHEAASDPSTGRIEHEPMAVQSQGRIYTKIRHRRQLGIQGKGYGTRLAVGFVREESRLDGPDGRLGQHGKYATTTVWLGKDGEFTIPSEVREYLGVEYGDTVRMTATVVDPQ